jgi:two-component system, chemotaxis family, protein-glutamate methylesterase/glutaminase
LTTAFVVDDSAVARTVLTETLSAGGIQVLGSASDPLFAWQRLQARWPDVIVLDVEMPRMDGITFLHKLMAERPTPVVMCSSLTEQGCQTTLRALAAGAVGFVTKPRSGLRDFLADRGHGLVAAVTAAAQARPRTLPQAATPDAGNVPARWPTARPGSADARVVAIGLSTGGVQALELVLRGLDRQCPGLVVVQHMPEKFTAALASRLDRLLDLEVLEAVDGQAVCPGRVLIAPGSRHLRLAGRDGRYTVEVRDGPLINHHRPSVDVLFRSVAQCAGRQAIAVLMTGMGDDGARGLKALRDAGAITAAQDEASCVVFGMPQAAWRLGGARDMVPLAGVAGWIRQAADTPLRA